MLQNEVHFECDIGNMEQGESELARFKWSSAGKLSINAQVASELLDPDLSNNEAMFMSATR